jgi:hypothetical protein
MARRRPPAKSRISSQSGRASRATRSSSRPSASAADDPGGTRPMAPTHARAARRRGACRLARGPQCGLSARRTDARRAPRRRRRVSREGATGKGAFGSSVYPRPLAASRNTFAAAAARDRQSWRVHKEEGQPLRGNKPPVLSGPHVEESPTDCWRKPPACRRSRVGCCRNTAAGRLPGGGCRRPAHGRAPAAALPCAPGSPGNRLRRGERGKTSQGRSFHSLRSRWAARARSEAC